MKLVIAEKPMLARDIARAICGRSVSENAPLPISGNGYTVIACAGHLLQLVEPEELNPAWGKPWSLDALPIEVPDWPKEPAPDKRELVDRIAGLLEKADSVIAAGDPDDEGQLIVDELLDYLGYAGRVERVYVNDNIEKNIVRAFGQLVPNDGCRGVGRAAYARQMADMCFGVNETRLATLRLHTLCTVGRVQTPTMGLVVARDDAIEHHTKRKYFVLSAEGDCGDAGGDVTFCFKPGRELLGDEKHLFAREALDRLKERLDGRELTFETTVTRKQACPPLPYNLTVLLADMSKRYGFAAAKTQQITQDLRDKYKAITYNRSDSQYLKEEHFQDAPAVLSQAMRNLGTDWALDFGIRSKAFNDGNVTAHHAIIPQEADAPVSRMTGDESKVYRAIVERYAMQFLPPMVYDLSTSTFPVEEGTFSATAKRVVSYGFRETFGGDAQEEGVDADPDALWVPEGSHQLCGVRCTVRAKETTPPKPYTEGTLIMDMAAISKYVTDPEVKAILKKKDDGKMGEHGGIGTTATRAAIIENLKKRGYLAEQKGKVHATDKAKAFYRLLPPEIRGADVTARWWLIQQSIAEGSDDVNAVQRSVIQVFRSHMASAYVGESAGASRTSVGRCPVCGKEVVQCGRAYSCSSNQSEKQEDGTWKQVSGCGFKILPFCGKTLTPKQAGGLLDGKSVSLKGCRSKAGKTFDCRLSLKKDGTLAVAFAGKKK